MAATFSWQKFESLPIIGIIRNTDPGKLPGITASMARTGLLNLEITMNSPAAAKIITELVDKIGEQMNVGAGTVCSYSQLQSALAAGAKFIVTPILDEGIIKCCVDQGIPVFPGAFTPTEIYRAWSWGASMVKIFPASQLGAPYIKEILAPLTGVKLLPTGGIGLHNLSAFLDAGAKGLGIGSHLFPIDIIKNDQWEDLENHFLRFKRTFEKAINVRKENSITL